MEIRACFVRGAFDRQPLDALLNCYDDAQRHYIGPHRDRTSGLVEGAPIVTISLGARRSFRLRPAKGKGFVDFDVTHGAVLVLSWESNLHLKHDVPHRARDVGRRISITARALE